VSWREKARCREVDPDLFFADKGEAARTHAAKRICQQCEVAKPCLNYAMTHTGIAGVWGATTERDRQELKRRGKAS
jgi:WhiB family redox-sensing transcriptional regulator